MTHLYHEPADPHLPRIDLVLMRKVLNDPMGWSFEIIAGTPSWSPEPPERPHDAVLVWQVYISSQMSTDQELEDEEWPQYEPPQSNSGAAMDHFREEIQKLSDKMAWAVKTAPVEKSVCRDCEFTLHRNMKGEVVQILAERCENCEAVR